MSFIGNSKQLLVGGEGLVTELFLEDLNDEIKERRIVQRRVHCSDIQVLPLSGLILMTDIIKRTILIHNGTEIIQELATFLPSKPQNPKIKF